MVCSSFGVVCNRTVRVRLQLLLLIPRCSDVFGMESRLWEYSRLYIVTCFGSLGLCFMDCISLGHRIEIDQFLLENENLHGPDKSIDKPRA